MRQLFNSTTWQGGATLVFALAVNWDTAITTSQAAISMAQCNDVFASGELG